ncbi:MAG: hypothetical protein HY010_18690 [Acidobacteria bacterium]|nr:hypothetical protein [Acidobacteriota bacterium]
MLTGTLIEDLIATVERAELRTQMQAQADAELMAEMEPWFVSVQDGVGFDNELRGVA